MEAQKVNCLKSPRQSAEGVVCKSYFVCKTLPFYIPCNGPETQWLQKCPSSKWGWGREGGEAEEKEKESTFLTTPSLLHSQAGGMKE